MRHLLTAPALCAAATLAAPAAHAVEYNQVRADESRIEFAYQQMGVNMDGRFRRFSAQLAFDPARPEAAKAVLEVPLAGVATGVKALGGNRYEIAGELTLKGQTRAVVVPTTVDARGNSALFDGVFTLKRGDFAIGEGAWAKFDVVADEVQIKFHIAATGN